MAKDTEKVFTKKRLLELLVKFGPRVKRVPFTAEGLPGDEEVTLTKDIWSALTTEEKKKTLKNTAKVVAKERKVKPEQLPDQTPYSMRLTHRFLQLEAKKG